MSLARLTEHRQLWAAKPSLRRVYQPWFESLLSTAPPGARVLEVGAGPGLLAAYAREQRPDLRWIASDIHPASWNHVAADAVRLPFRSASFGAVVGLDILHHVARPAAFLSEAARVLAEGGRLSLIEPWITPLSWFIYHFFHQEHCGLRIDPWNPFPEAKDSFDGAAAVPWKMVRTTSPERWRTLGLEPPSVRPFNAFSYLLSLGFRRPSLLPMPLVGLGMAFDRRSAPIAPLTALRAGLCWRRATPDAAGPSEER